MALRICCAALYKVSEPRIESVMKRLIKPLLDDRQRLSNSVAVSPDLDIRIDMLIVPCTKDPLRKVSCTCMCV
jgi:hypothetical protein